MAYFSNGSEGEKLDLQCLECVLSDHWCPIDMLQSEYNYKQVEKGSEALRAAMNLLINEKGVCQMLIALSEVGALESMLVEDRPVEPHECHHCLGKDEKCLACDGEGLIY